MADQGLVKLEKAERLLAEVSTATEAKQLADYAEAARVWAKKAKLGTSAINYATLVKLKAESRMADMVDEGQARGEIARQARPNKPSLGEGLIATLSDLDINHRHLHEARTIRDEFTVDDLTELKSAADEANQELSRKALIKVAQSKKRNAKELEREKKRKANRKKVKPGSSLDALVESGATFSTITIDPPWDWSDEGDINQMGRAKPDYATMPVSQIAALPVDRLAEKNAHLYLWITNRSLPKGFDLLERWGFRYITCLTWCKPSFGMGNYFRGSTEQVLFGVRGSLPLQRKDVGTWFSAPRPRKQHSAKPEEFYQLVSSCSPEPRLEMFGRWPRHGWTVWGEDGTQG